MAKEEKAGLIIKFKDTVKVVGTAKAKMKTGKVYEVHPVQAEKLIKSGRAAKPTKE